MTNYGCCSVCGSSVGMTKKNKAVRHGFIRVRKGYTRINIPSIPSGSDAYECKGSWEYCRGYDVAEQPKKDELRESPTE